MKTASQALSAFIANFEVQSAKLRNAADQAKFLRERDILNAKADSLDEALEWARMLKANLRHDS